MSHPTHIEKKGVYLIPTLKTDSLKLIGLFVELILPILGKLPHNLIVQYLIMKKMLTVAEN